MVRSMKKLTEYVKEEKSEADKHMDLYRPVAELSK